MIEPPVTPPRRIGLVGFDGVAALDLVGVQDAFTIANGSAWPEPPSRYEPVVVAPTAAPFRTEAGLRMTPDCTFDEAPTFDTLVVPGGGALRETDTRLLIAHWLRDRAKTTRRVVSVCTGAFALAEAGLLDGRRATTHWRYAADLQRAFPKVKVDADAIFVRDGAVYTSAGMTAGIDLALALIEEDHGSKLALAVARQLVVYMKRTGGQLQYSEPLRSQTRGGDRFADLASALAADPGGAWTVEAMAARCGLSPRQFTRRFKDVFKATPAAHLDALRFDEARRRLATTADSLGGIVEAVGLRSEEAFRRAFERRFGVTPSAYRRQFAAHARPMGELR